MADATGGAKELTFASAETTDRAIQGGLPEAGHDPAVPLRVPRRKKGVEAVRDGLGAAAVLRLRDLAPFPVLLRGGHRRWRGGVDRDLAPLEGARTSAEVDLVRGRTVGQHHGTDVLADIAAHGVRDAGGEQDHGGTDREQRLHLPDSSSSMCGPTRRPAATER